MSVQADIKTIAARLAGDALKDDTKIGQRLDIFKALTAYYAILAKPKNRDREDDPGDGPTMGSIREQMREAEHAGRAPIRTDSRRNRDGD